MPTAVLPATVTADLDQAPRLVSEVILNGRWVTVTRPTLGPEQGVSVTERFPREWAADVANDLWEMLHINLVPTHKAEAVAQVACALIAIDHDAI